MEEDGNKDKTRKEKRKESRFHKRQKQFTSWLGHQKQNSRREKAKEKNRQFLNSKPNSKGISVEKKHKGKNSYLENAFSANNKVKMGLERRPKSKFHEYLKMEMTKGVISAEEDLEMERKLTKKLKLKERNLGGLNDGLNVLIKGIPSELGSEFDDFLVSEDDYDHDGIKIKIGKRKHEDFSAIDEVNKSEKEVHSVARGKKQKQIKSSKAFVKNLEEHCPVDKTIDSAEYNDASNVEEPSMEEQKPDVGVNYTAPHLRAGTRCESEEYAHIRRRVRGFLNKLSESNLESIVGEVATIFQSVTRNVCCQIVGTEIVASCILGPRGNEQHAAVFAAFVAGMACFVGIDFSAKLLASIARSFEDERHKGDSLSLRNLSLLLCHLYMFGVCASDIVFDLLDVLNKGLTELDVSTILTILQCCGMKLRGDDPISMKYFVVTIQNRVNEMKSDSKCIKEGEPRINSKRMEFMLETICDIKNNKKRSKEDPSHHMRIKKWLQKLQIEDVLLRGLTWSKLLDPEKKGQWWYSGEINSTAVNFEEVATTFNKDVQEAQKLVQLAAAQRMNTDARRAIFCIIMSGEDYIDAFEKILRLDLSGKQDREIMRVLVDCCLQEKVFNKYYTVLASKFCSHDKNHKFTLQYCIWDHLKEIDSMEMIRLMNLARFISEMLSSFSLSLALLKTVDLMDPSQFTPRRIMHFRMLFDALFENTDALVWNVFTRVAVAPELETLRSGLLFFLSHYVVTANSDKTIAQKFRIAKKALGHPAAPANAPSGGLGMQLGKAQRSSQLIQSLQAEGELILDDAPRTVAQSISSLPPTDLITLTIEERLNIIINRDSGVRNFDVQGTLSLHILNQEDGLIQFQTENHELPGLSFKTHPNINKELFNSKHIIGLKDPNRPFPTGQNDVSLMKWRIHGMDESALPLTVNCWPSISGRETSVNIEYEATEMFDLQNVVISIPLPAIREVPNVLQINGEWRYDARSSTLEWSILLIENSNRSGSMEFVVPPADPSAFFPITIRFNAAKTFSDVKVVNVIPLKGGPPPKYVQRIQLVTDTYQVV